MSQLGDNLKNAAAYEVAKVATDRKITLADDDIDALAAHITSVVLEELASRELQGREVASRDETTNTWAEHSVRIDEYAEAARDLRFGVSDEDRSEPTPEAREPRVWREGDTEPDPRPRVVTTPDGRERTFSEDWGGWLLRNEVGLAGGPVQWDDLPKPLTEKLFEVVTPEGTP